MTVRIIHGNMLEVLATLDADIIDSCVTDPPYHLTSIVKRFGKTSLDDDTQTSERSRGGADGYARAARGFMGKTWDGGDIASRAETWIEVYRVLKPGAHLLAFGGTRTYHRMVCAIEDAGFEIRDTMGWLYGSGFPKSHDISKAIDRATGAEREITKSRALTGKARVLRGGNFTGDYGDRELNTQYNETAPTTDDAKRWSGWGTALKPAMELICVARKPLGEKTVAANVLRFGCGGINVDGCRVDAADNKRFDRAPGNVSREQYRKGTTVGPAIAVDYGRWPANVCHDGSDEVLAAFPATTVSGSSDKRGGCKFFMGEDKRSDSSGAAVTESGSAARFFYTAKADKAERAESKHPTVKPTDLMRYLVRLVTPPGGTVLDPFCGTGSTLVAADQQQFNAIGIDMEEQYISDARKKFTIDAGLFADLT